MQNKRLLLNLILVAFGLLLCFKIIFIFKYSQTIGGCIAGWQIGNFLTRSNIKRMFSYLTKASKQREHNEIN